MAKKVAKKTTAKPKTGDGKSKTAEIVEHWKSNRDAKPADLVKQFGVSLATVNKAKKEAGLVKARKGKGKKPGRKPAVHSTNGHAGDYAAIHAAARFIKAAGGVEQAKEALKVASELAAALG